MTASRLNHATAGRLVKILGMLGSDHAGERAAAAKKAHTLVREAGLTWHDVLMPSPSITPMLEDSCNWRAMAAECFMHKAKLSSHEAKFIENILTWRAAPSSKQLSWLISIHAKIHVSKGASK